MSRFWGVLLVLDVLIITDIDTLAAYVVGTLAGGLFIALAKKARDEERRRTQEERDAQAQAIEQQLTGSEQTGNETEDKVDHGAH